MTFNAKAQRRSLKDCLKSVLSRHRPAEPDHLTLGSGVFKRNDPSLALLPAFASLSTLPDVGSSRFDINQYSVPPPERHHSVAAQVLASDLPRHAHNCDAKPISNLGQSDINDTYQDYSQLSQLAKTCSDEQEWYPGLASPSQRTIGSCDDVHFSRLPTIPSEGALRSRSSLAQLMTTDLIHFQSPLSQIANACNIPSIYRHGASLQASLASLKSLSPSPSASTLRLQRSIQDLTPSQAINPAPQFTTRAVSTLSSSTTSSPRSAVASKQLGRGQCGRNLPSPSPNRGAPRPPHCSSDLEPGLSSINHFSSVCVLDAATPGCPVTATSTDLRFIFDIGEEFCLNTAGVDGATMDTVTGQDANGNAVVHLVIYSPLVNPNSGRSRFVLVSLLDITTFITDAASLPDLETISEESVVEEEAMTPPKCQKQSSPKFELSPEILLGGCIIADHEVHATREALKEDIWLDIASEETRKSRSIKSSPSTIRSSSTATSLSTQSMNDVLDQFLGSLQELYSDFFLLGKSPLDENSYEICNVSPRVHQSGEYIHGHLTKTPAADKTYLEARLTQNEAFCLRVRWGVTGELKQLYCVPLFGQSNITWVCFLVEEERWAGLPIWE